MLYVMIMCIIYYITFIFNSVLYTIMCMISINNNNNIMFIECLVSTIDIEFIIIYVARLSVLITLIYWLVIMC